MPRRSPVAVLGGTFDRLHVGHKALLDAAFARGGAVGVGVTTDRFLRSRRKAHARRLRPYRARLRAVRRYLAARYPRRRWWTVPLDDPWGGSVLPGVDLLVVSEETRSGADRVNAERARRGLAPVAVHAIPRVRGDDLLPVSASRIRAGAIDAEGRRLRPLAVGLLADAPAAWADAVRAAAERAWGAAVPLRWVRRGASAGRRRGARDRRTVTDLALRARGTAEYGIALLAPDPRGGEIAIADADGAVGRPIRLARASSIGPAVDRLLGARQRRVRRR